MVRIEKKKKLRASILDRLIDNDPQSIVDVEANNYHQLENLRNSVRRDLQNLLNTRYKITEPPDEYNEVTSSILNYGLPDLATVNMSDIEKRKQFTSYFESIIREYEPRFKGIKVTYLDNSDKLDRTVHFRIDATLYADPYPEIIVFDSALDPVTRSINIKEIRNV